MKGTVSFRIGRKVGFTGFPGAAKALGEGRLAPNGRAFDLRKNSNAPTRERPFSVSPGRFFFAGFQKGGGFV